MIERIISGGQTGADRAALDWAIAHGIPHGGSCTKGRRAEDGTIPPQYQLTELLTTDYPARTLRNVLDADATLIVTVEPEMSGGTLLTARLAHQRGKPLLHVHADTEEAGEALRRFIDAHRVRVLNVAGPRASGAPQVGALVARVLEGLASLTSG